MLKYTSITANGGQKISEPLLVIHGEGDNGLDFRLTKKAVDETVSRFPASQLQFVQLPHSTHGGALTGSQRVWMEWIADRFAGKPAEAFNENSTSVLVPARPASAYVLDRNWVITHTKEVGSI